VFSYTCIKPNKEETMDTFTLTWSTSIMDAVKQFVTVRDAMGNKLDMSKPLLEMPIYNNSALL
jgi:hypothetical protein